MIEPFVSDRDCTDCGCNYNPTQHTRGRWFDIHRCVPCEEIRLAIVAEAAADKLAGVKKCSCCKDKKALSEFSPRGKNGVQSRCKDCRRRLNSGHETNQKPVNPNAWNAPAMSEIQKAECRRFNDWKAITRPGLIGPTITARLAA